MVKFKTNKPVETPVVGGSGGASRTTKSRKKSNVHQTEGTGQVHGTAELHQTDQIAKEGGSGQGHPDGKRLERQVFERAMELGSGYYGTETGSFDPVAQQRAGNTEAVLPQHKVKSNAARYKAEIPQLGDDAERLVRDLTEMLSAVAA